MTATPTVLMRYCRWSILAGFCLTACSEQPVQNQNLLPSTTQKPKQTMQSFALQDNKPFQRLQDARSAIKAGNNPAAVQALDIINYASLPNEQRSVFNLLSAQIALSNANAELALNKLVLVRPILLSDSDKIDYYQALAFAQSLTNHVLAAVDARIKLGYLYTLPEQQQENIVTILNMLSSLSIEELNAPASTMTELNGWTDLAKVFKQRGDLGFDVNQQIELWRQRYPSHPANTDFLTSYLAKLSNNAVNVSAVAPGGSNSNNFIAVLLPASGNYAQTGKAIKDGILAAAQQFNGNGQKQALKFYDTEQGDIVTIYKQALNEGAKQVIGPLLKEQIQTLAYNTEFTIPVLALNHIEDLIKGNLYQFGLSPIDEAGQLALKAKQDGHLNAVLLMPNTSQGQRIGQYLTTAWQNLGGQVVGIQSYDVKQHDIADILSGLLSSSADQTSSAVFLSASPESAGELSAKLKYYQNQNIAIYAMPNVYRAHPSPVQDAELGKIKFCDLPWLFPEIYTGNLSQTALQTTWQNLNDNQIRLVALGIDAYNILNHLTDLNRVAYSGATGRLLLNSDNRVTRSLVCAQFQAGLPVVSGFIE